MINSNIKSKYINIQKDRICQWEILKDISFFVWNPENKKIAEEIILPYSIVFTQDCDLSEDYKQRKNNQWEHDKLLKTILVCPAYWLEQFCNWEHIDWQNMKKFSKKLKERIQKNDIYKRYHYLEWDWISFPDSVIDFKHFYTVQSEIIYNKNSSIYISSISELFREEL